MLVSEVSEVSDFPPPLNFSPLESTVLHCRTLSFNRIIFTDFTDHLLLGLQGGGGGDPVAGRERGLGVDDLPGFRAANRGGHLPKAVGGTGVADRDVAALLEPVRDGASVSAVPEEVVERPGRDGQYLHESEGVRVFQFFDYVFEFALFGRAVGVDNVPERGGLRRRCLGVKLGDVEFVEVGGDVAIAAVRIPFPKPVPVTVDEIRPGEVAPRHIVPCGHRSEGKCRRPCGSW